MGGYFPGPLGIATFAGIKFVGYSAAALALKKIVPSVHASVWKIAAVRTGLGVILGVPATLLGVWVASLAAPHASDGQLFYFVLVFVRVLIWYFLLFVFAKGAELSRTHMWLVTLAGAGWSCLLDWPAYHLMTIAPGQIPVC